MVRYSFLVRLSHPLLHAGLSRRLFDHLIRPLEHLGSDFYPDCVGSFRLIASSYSSGTSTGRS